MTIQQIEDAEYHYDDFCTYPDVSTQPPKQRWKIRTDGDITRTQEIVHLGQQTLKRV
jgi:hypothetical protein